MVSKNIPDKGRLRAMNPKLNVMVYPSYSTDVGIHRPAPKEPPPYIDACKDIRNLVNQCYLDFVIHMPSLIERTLPPVPLGQQILVRLTITIFEEIQESRVAADVRRLSTRPSPEQSFNLLKMWLLVIDYALGIVQYRLGALTRRRSTKGAAA